MAEPQVNNVLNEAVPRAVAEDDDNLSDEVLEQRFVDTFSISKYLDSNRYLTRNTRRMLSTLNQTSIKDDISPLSYDDYQLLSEVIEEIEDEEIPSCKTDKRRNALEDLVKYLQMLERRDGDKQRAFSEWRDKKYGRIYDTLEMEQLDQDELIEEYLEEYYEGDHDYDDYDY